MRRSTLLPPKMQATLYYGQERMRCRSFSENTSHEPFQGKSQHLTLLARVMPLRTATVPLFSCMVLREDVRHAGTGAVDVTERAKKNLEMFLCLWDAIVCWQTEHGHYADEKAQIASGLFYKRDCRLRGFWAAGCTEVGAG